MRKASFILSIMLCLSFGARAQHRLDRGYDLSSMPTVASKGSWMVGGTAAWSMHDNSDFSLAVLDGINSNGYSVSASPEFCYFVKDNLGAGVRFSYGRSWLDLESASAGFGDVSLEVKDYSLLDQSYQATAFMRTMIPVGQSGRLAMFVDIGLQGSAAREKVIDGHSGYDVGTWQQKYGAAFLVNPGFTAFITKKMAMYVGVGMAGLKYTRREQAHNQVGNGTTSEWSANYLLDLTKLSIGIDFYL